MRVDITRPDSVASALRDTLAAVRAEHGVVDAATLRAAEHKVIAVGKRLRNDLSGIVREERRRIQRRHITHSFRCYIDVDALNAFCTTARGAQLCVNAEGEPYPAGHHYHGRTTRNVVEDFLQHVREPPEADMGYIDLQYRW